MITGRYIGQDPNLVGCTALLQKAPRTHYWDAQFTRTNHDDPACLQKNGPEPKASDVRFGWHRFREDEFEVIDDNR